MMDATLGLNIFQAEADHSDLFLSIALLDKNEAINDVYGVEYIDFLSDAEFNSLTQTLQGEVLHKVIVCPSEKWLEQRKTREANAIIQQLAQHLMTLFFQQIDIQQWKFTFCWLNTNLTASEEQDITQLEYKLPVNNRTIPLTIIPDKTALPPISTIAQLFIETKREDMKT